MQIQRLHFHPFGPFEDKSLDFSSSPLGLHIVYGQNEAGKSSSLRAISDLLFGFQHKTSDNWLFDNNKLCISADLLLSDETLLQISRFKRRKNDLIDLQAQLPIDQQLLTRQLGGLNREAFLHTFGISHESLRLGVESILAAGGNLGQTLFAASSGINQLNALMKRLEEKQAALFSPNARKPAINSAIQRIKDSTQALREATVSQDEWLKQKKKQEELSEQDQTFQATISAISKEILEKKRFQKGLGVLPLYRDTTTALDALNNIPNLEKDFSQKRTATQTELKEVYQQKLGLEKQLLEIDLSLANLNVNSDLLNNRLAIEKAAAEAEVHRKAQNDDRGIRARIHLIEEQALRQLNSIRPGLTLESLEQYQISSPFLQQTHQLQNEKIQLDQNYKNSKQALKNLEHEISELYTTLGKIKVQKDITELRRTYSLSVEQGTLENSYYDLKEEVETIHQQAIGQLKRLGLFEGDLHEIVEIPIPMKESVRIFADKFYKATQESLYLQEKIQTNLDASAEHKKHLAVLTQGDSIATFDQLKEYRQTRDDQWNTLKERLIEDNASSGQTIYDQQSSPLLAETFSSSLDKVDRLSDELIQNAERTAKIESFTRQLETLSNEKEVLENTKEDLNNKKNQVIRDWHALWSTCKISPLSPQEMLSWLDRYQELKNTLEKLTLSRRRLSQVQAQLDELCTQLCSSLRLHQTLPQKISLRRLLQLAQETIDAYQTSLNKRTQIEERLSELHEQSRKHALTIDELTSRKADWQQRWDRKIQHLEFPDDTDSNDIVFFLNSIGEILQQLQTSKDLKIRSEAIRRDYQKYSDRIKQLDRSLTANLASLAPEEAAYQLHSRLAENLEKQKDLIRLKEQSDKLRTNLELAEEKLVSLQERLAILCKQAKVSSVEELYDVEEKAAEKLQLKLKFDALSSQLAEISGGQDVTTFFKLIAPLDGDELSLSLKNLEEKQIQLQTDHRHVVEQLAVTRKELDSFSSDDEAAALAEQVETLRLETEENIEQYLTLKTASTILVKAIENYRKHNQNPVLELASGYFKELTEKNFIGIRADFDDKGAPILKAERNDGNRLTVEEMSDGSRDQLFLALRLGGLSRHIDKNGPMPFIVDDILIHFDDHRALAALNALSCLSRKTQIIFFTHHQHLVSLCRQLEDQDRLKIHTL